MSQFTRLCLVTFIKLFAMFVANYASTGGGQIARLTYDSQAIREVLDAFLKKEADLL